MELDELLELLTEKYGDEMATVAECPICGGLVGFNLLTKMYECMDCNGFHTKSLEEIKHWRVDGK